MKTITLVTFKGCQSTMDYKDELDDLIEQGRLDASVELVLVPTPAKAEEMGLHGSPTIQIDGHQWRKSHRGVPGFY